MPVIAAHTATAYDAATIAHPRSLQVATIAARAGGAVLVIDTVTITVINSSFGVFDNVLFLGLAGLLAFAVAWSVHVSARASGVARLGLGVLTFGAVFAVLGGLSSLADLAGRHVFSAGNVGLHGEWSFFSVGVGLLVIAGWTRSQATSRTAG